MNSISKETYVDFHSYIAMETGLSLRDDRADVLTKKILERMDDCGVNTPEEYLRLLQFSPRGFSELKTLVESITVGETFFFRNEPQFEQLQKTIIPELIKARQHLDTPYIRIWCAGCSTGEEPYSIAILLKEMLPSFEKWNVSIIATDINEFSLKSAKDGMYSKRSVELVPPTYLEKYFTKYGRYSALNDDIKSAVNFQYHNLAKDPFTFDGMLNLDLIMCRNVTIYFNLETTRRVISQFYNSLADGGYLFIGHAETLWSISEQFIPKQFPKTFLYQKIVGQEHKAIQFPDIPLSELPSFETLTYEDIPTEEFVVEKFKVEEVQTDGVQVEELPEDMMKQGTLLADQGKYEQAIKLMDEIISNNKLFAPAYYFKAVIHEKMGQYKDAIEGFKRVLYIDPTLTVCYFHLGNLFRATGKLNDAKREYKNCLNFLKKLEDDKVIEFTDGMTTGVLYRAVSQAIDLIE